MEHIWILVYFISVAIGLLAAFYSFHLYAAWRYPFLRDIGNYTVVFNLVMVLYLIVKYASANLPGPAAKDQQSSFYTIMVLAALLGEIGLITTFFRVRKTNKEIKDQLFISYNTVKNHIYNIYQKLGVNSRSQMICRVLQVQRNSENLSGQSESRVSAGNS